MELLIGAVAGVLLVVFTKIYLNWRRMEINSNGNSRNMIIINDWSDVKSLEVAMKYWITCFIFALAGEADEIYFYKDGLDWKTTYKSGERYFHLLDPPDYYYDNFKECLVGIFTKDNVSDYLYYNSDGHFTMFLFGSTINYFVFHNNFISDTATIKPIYDKTVKDLAQKIIDSYEHGDLF